MLLFVRSCLCLSVSCGELVVEMSSWGGLKLKHHWKTQQLYVHACTIHVQSYTNKAHIINFVLYLIIGANGKQSGVHLVLSRWPAQKQGEEDLWRVSDCPSPTSLSLSLSLSLPYFPLLSRISPLSLSLLLVFTCLQTLLSLRLNRFHATLYQCPETAPEREEMTVAVANRINDLQSVLRTTEDHSLTQLQEIGQEIDTWQTKVRLNM